MLKPKIDLEMEARLMSLFEAFLRSIETEVKKEVDNETQDDNTEIAG